MADIKKTPGQKDVDIGLKDIQNGEVTINIEGKKKKSSGGTSSGGGSSVKANAKVKTEHKRQDNNNQDNSENQENPEEKQDQGKEQNKKQNESPENEQEKANEMFKDQDKAGKDGKKGDQKGLDKAKEHSGAGEGGPKPDLGKQVEAGSGKLPTPGQGGMKLPGGQGGAGNLAKNLGQGLKNGASKAGGAAKNAAKEAAKKAAKAAAEAIKKALKKAAAAAAKFILTNPVALIVIACILGGLLIYGIWKGNSAAEDIKATVDTVNNMKTAISNGQLQGEVNQVNNALELNADYGSYLGFTMDQINYVYNEATKMDGVDKDSTRAATIKAYKDVYGRNGDHNDGMARLTDNKALYKHILLTEKYGFNRIKWENYNHNQNGARTLDESELKKDRELGIMYPNDDKTKAEDFMKLTSPYLMTNYIPQSFLIAESNSGESSVFSTGIKSNEEVLGELGFISDAGGIKENSYVYQFLKYGLADLTVSQYNIKHYDLNTYYLDYIAKKYQDNYTITATITYEEEYDRNGNRTLTPSSRTMGGFTVKSTSDRTYLEGQDKHVNTRKENQNGDLEGDGDVMKETFVSDNTHYENLYYVTYAKVFDTIKDNKYTYTKYNDNGPTTRTGANSESTIKSDYNETDNENCKVDKLTATSYNDLQQYVESCTPIRNEYEKSTPVTISTNPITGVTTKRYTVKQDYTVKGKTYTEKIGDRYDTERNWYDEVTAGETTTKAFNVGEVTDFNKSEDPYKDQDAEDFLNKFNFNISLGKEMISEDTFKASDDYAYYQSLAEEKKLNVSDVFDSNPGVYQNYISPGSAQSQYIGRGRDNVFIKTAYDLVLEKYMDTIATDNKLNLVYGSTLGYEVSDGNTSGGAGYGTAYGLMLQLLHEFEGGGTKFQNAEGVDCYKVMNVVGNMTVGYGVDITVNPSWKTQLEQQMGSSITFGTLVPCEYVDAIEQDFINRKLESIESTLSSNNIELAEYQKHALLIRMYNTGNIVKFPSMYKSYYKADVDDRYEATYEKFAKDAGNVSAITSCADLSSQLYQNYLSVPVTSNGKTLQGLVTRRREEYYLFSLGYYTHNNLHAFYTKGLSFNGINLINPDGSIAVDGCVELQAALEDQVFSGKLHTDAPNMSRPWGHAIRPNGAENSDDHHNLSDNYKEFFAKSLYYQCPWWSRGRANVYLNSVNPEVFKGCFIRDGLGDGKNLAKGVADAYGVPFYTDIKQLTGNCIISWGAGQKYGHTAYVEAVGNDYYVISHCGSGIAWQGVGIVPKTNNGLGASYGLVGFVKMDDIVAKYNK